MTRRRRAYAVAVVATGSDGTVSVKVAAAFNDYNRAADLCEKLSREHDKRLDSGTDNGIDIEVHVVALSTPTIKEMLS